MNTEGRRGEYGGRGKDEYGEGRGKEGRDKLKIEAAKKGNVRERGNGSARDEDS